MSITSLKPDRERQKLAREQNVLKLVGAKSVSHSFRCYLQMILGVKAKVELYHNVISVFQTSIKLLLIAFERSSSC